MLRNIEGAVDPEISGTCSLPDVQYVHVRIVSGRPGGVAGYPRAWYRSVS